MAPIMPTIKVSGFPKVRVISLVFYLKKVLCKEDTSLKFWVRELEDVRGDSIMDLKQATIEFNSESQAKFALKLLDGHVYDLKKQAFPLRAWMVDSYRPPRHEDREWRRTVAPNRQIRSRSPTFRDTTSQLDMEIELLRKQRMVIEEERRLLIEREKLEIVRELGPSASKDLGYTDDLRHRYTSPDRTEYRSRNRVHERSTPPRRESQIPRREHKKSTRSVPKHSVPIFFMPCVKIIAEMDEYIRKYSYQEERGMLVKLIKDTLRQRLASALENMKYKPTHKIIKLYRNLHPASQDESLVKNLVATMRGESFPTESTHYKREREENIKTDPEDSTLVVGVNDSAQIDNDKTEYALSLDATALGESPYKDETNKDWIEGGTSWLE